MEQDEKDWADLEADCCLAGVPVVFHGISTKIAEALREAVARGYNAGWSSGERSEREFPRTN